MTAERRITVCAQAVHDGGRRLEESASKNARQNTSVTTIGCCSVTGAPLVATIARWDAQGALSTRE